MDTVFIAFRSQLLRDAVRSLLGDAGFSIAGEADDLTATVGRLLAEPRRQVDAVIIDASFCADQPNAVVAVRQASREARIIILAYEPDLAGVSGEQVMAADGVLTFGLSAESMIHSLRLIQTGERVVPRELMESLIAREAEEPAKVAPGDALSARQPRSQAPSPREAEILNYLLRGDSNKMIARELGITEATVKVHLKGLLRKIRACNRTQAAIWALNNGFSIDNIRPPQPSLATAKRAIDATACAPDAPGAATSGRRRPNGVAA